jgi:hypothetical protein
MKTRTRIAPQVGASGEDQLEIFIDKFDSKNAALIRSARKTLRERLPAANELVYDNYNFFVIGYCSTERQSDCSSTMGPFSPIRSSCFSAAAARTVSSGSSRRRRWRIRGSRSSSPLPLHRLRGRCLRAAEANWSFDQSRKNRSRAANRRISWLHCRNINYTHH